MMYRHFHLAMARHFRGNNNGSHLVLSSQSLQQNAINAWTDIVFCDHKSIGITKFSLCKNRHWICIWSAINFKSHGKLFKARKTTCDEDKRSLFQQNALLACAGRFFSPSLSNIFLRKLSLMTSFHDFAHLATTIVNPKSIDIQHQFLPEAQDCMETKCNWRCDPIF